MSRRSKGPRHKDDLDVKLSPGGIREIEFFAQALTLTFGGRLPHLRKPDTLSALKALAGEGVITTVDVDVLSRAYCFLRTVEHRLQQRDPHPDPDPAQKRSRAGSPGSVHGIHPGPLGRVYGPASGPYGFRQQRFSYLLSEPDSGTGTGDEKEKLPPWVTELKNNLADQERSLNLLAEAGFKRPDAAWPSAGIFRTDGSCPTASAGTPATWTAFSSHC